MDRSVRSLLSLGMSLLLMATVAHGVVLAGGEDVSIANVPEIIGDGKQKCLPDNESVTKAIEFRSRIGVESAENLVRTSFDTPGYICTAFGIPLTVAEAQNLVRHVNAQAELADLAEELTHDPTFGGAWLEGTTLVVRSTTGRLGEGTQHRRGVLERRSAQFTFAELEAVAEEIAKTVRDGSAARLGVDISLVSVDPRTNRVDVGIADDVENARTALKARYGDLVTVRHLTPSPAEHLCTKNDCGTKGGLTITKSGLTCTSGFVVKARKNGGAWGHYMLTAGHCIHHSGGIASTASWKNGAGTITWDRSKGHSFWEYECAAWHRCWDNDLGLFALGDDVPATRNQYFAGGGAVVAMTGSKTKANQLIGQTVWRHGTTSGFDSGVIQAKPNSYAYSCFPHTCKHFNVVQVGHGSANGDSGSGYYRFYTEGGVTKRDAYGILSLGPTGGSETYYYAWNEYFDDYSNNVCDVWTVQPCTTGACTL